MYLFLRTTIFKTNLLGIIGNTFVFSHTFRHTNKDNFIVICLQKEKLQIYFKVIK